MTTRAGRCGGRPGRGAAARCRRLGGALAIGALSACADLASDPATPASLEFATLPFPAIAVGDSLRDTLGVARPLRAIARNLAGDVIEEAPLRYLSRSAALRVDSVTGQAEALELPSGGQADVTARFAERFQITARIPVVTAPDTVFATGDPRLTALRPESESGAAEANSVAIDVRLQAKGATGTLQNTGGWLVRFAVVRPANRQNDTTAAVFLVDDNRRASQFDTAANSGVATRSVRVRPTQFPAAGRTADTVEVEAMVYRRGVPVPGAPVRIRVPVAVASTPSG
jgi:hypothetical protein